MSNIDVNIVAIPKTLLWEIGSRYSKDSKNSEYFDSFHYGCIGDVYERQTNHGQQNIIRNVPIFLVYIEEVIDQDYYRIEYFRTKEEAELNLKIIQEDSRCSNVERCKEQANAKAQ